MAEPTNLIQRDRVQWVGVDRLLLDPSNPRLTALVPGADQDEILRELYKRYDLSDLLESLARNGYFDEEPLIAVPAIADQPDGPLTVVEGNRRLAAVKLLLLERARQTVGARDVPEPAPEIRARLDPIPVKLYAKRDDVVPYLGVRHIAGVKEWDALAKARYIKSLVEQGHDLKKVGQMVGMKRGDVVRRWLLTLFVLNQANETSDQPWEVASRDFNFSFLYTALGYASVREQLALSIEDSNNPRSAPVPPQEKRTLLRVMRDLYGAPDTLVGAKVKESRQIRQLAEVYGSREALEDLRAGASLDEAHRKTAGEEQQLVDLLLEASRDLAQANGLAPHHRGSEDALRLARRCAESSKTLVEVLQG